MALIGQDEGRKKIVLRMLSESLSMLENSRQDMGRFSWIREEMVRKPMSTNRMENGIKLLNASCSTLPKADILFFVPAALWKEEN